MREKSINLLNLAKLKKSVIKKKKRKNFLGLEYREKKIENSFSVLHIVNHSSAHFGVLGDKNLMKNLAPFSTCSNYCANVI